MRAFGIAAFLSLLTLVVALYARVDELGDVVEELRAVDRSSISVERREVPSVGSQGIAPSTLVQAPPAEFRTSDSPPDPPDEPVQEELLLPIPPPGLLGHDDLPDDLRDRIHPYTVFDYGPNGEVLTVKLTRNRKPVIIDEELSPIARGYIDLTCDRIDFVAEASSRGFRRGEYEVSYEKTSGHRLITLSSGASVLVPEADFRKIAAEFDELRKEDVESLRHLTALHSIDGVFWNGGFR